MQDRLILADCLDALADLPDGSIHLIYLDPPFNTHRRRAVPTADGKAVTRSESQGVRTDGKPPAYPDAFGPPANYVAFMRPRVERLRRLLRPNGSLFLHCDWRMSHHVRLMLDEVFAIHPSLPAQRSKGQGRFINEIVWHYGLGASKARRHLLTKHDVIFWYAGSSDHVFNLIRQKPTGAMLNKYCHVDENGQRYMMSYGKRYTLRGGKPLDDVWDIPSIAPTSSERVGYPTQKPLALLRRIVQLASNVGDAVLDPFCGSGTTLVAAQQLGRHWIGIDSNPQAIAIARRRLRI
jgi:site-specific DNA-methyltransferase (adenine-specific)